MILRKLTEYFDQKDDQRMLEIESMKKIDMSLDEQFKLIEEYNKLWDKANRK